MATQVKTDDLIEMAKDMLCTLNEKPEAAPLLAAYDMRIQFNVLDGESFHAVLRDGRLQSVEHGRCEGFSNRDDLEVFGQEAGLRLVFEKRMSPATAMYYGKMTPRGERAKHCQVAVAYTLLRIAQEEPTDMITQL
jgi:hypothetical protein